ncbi:hypothetical protein KCP91_08185 [Microvirga sp. SRT01]|uniref:Phage gp6-like head-tail connector protein n=1 Tax=Sphingomonas longa TaxID=2778730 RepID=A0ABS2D5Y9_9SPHN|nr:MULTISPECIES: hypothetical protein [Alphaproteobacteria]MBM6576349.1 hypothetical protein [Sphingomonas sp. BT552]MBR7709395.1 hypothetical protein [Microvirga sp. SRT01]
MAAAPLTPESVLPAALIDQYVKPSEAQAALVGALRLSAISWVEGHTRHSLARRLWTATFDSLSDAIALPREPVRSVSLLVYRNALGETVEGAGLWRLDGNRLLPISGARWAADVIGATAVTVTFDAGYDDVSVEAPGLQIAALMMMKHLLDGGSVDDVPNTVRLLLDEQYRTPVIA